MYGWPLLVHYCTECSYNTPVEYSASVWSEEHSCNHCGIRSTGADIAGQSKGTMNHGQHDELSQLFAMNMHLSSNDVQQYVQSQQSHNASEPTSLLAASEKDGGQVHYISSPVHFISSHYTGTAHVCAETQSEPSRSPPPAYRESLMPEAMAETLRQHSINPSALLPSQIQLFANADYEQRLRLLELWRIAPPSWPSEDHLRGSDYNTNLQQEEQAAMIRYEQQMQARSMPPEEHMLDTYVTEPNESHRNSMPISPIRGPGEPAWPPAARMRASSISGYNAAKANAEPYRTDGYRSDGMRQTALDPVYAADARLWQAPSYAAVHHPNSMVEEQQIRNHADWERLNEQMMRERTMESHRQAADDDMVM